MNTHCLILLWAIASAQPGPSKTATDQRPIALGDPYIDGSEEFSIRPPAGWQLNRQRIPDARGVTLLRMMGPPVSGQERQITLRRTVTPKRMSADETLKQMVDTLGLEVNLEKIDLQQVEQVAERPGAFVSASYVREAQRWQRMQAMVEVAPRSYLVLVYDGPAQIAAQSESMFQLVAASLTLLQRRLNEDELKAAIDAGAAWKESLTAASLKAALIPSQYFRVENEGGEGFLVVEEGEYVFDQRPGVRVSERGWTFDRDGRAQSFENILFLSLDQQNEKWQTKTTTLVAAEGKQPEHLEGTDEEGLREKDVLLSSQSYALRMPKAENPAVRLPRSYLSRALTRMLPALLQDREKPRRMAFTTFDHLRADLVILLVDIKGPLRRRARRCGGSRSSSKSMKDWLPSRRSGMWDLMEKSSWRSGGRRPSSRRTRRSWSGRCARAWRRPIARSASWKRPTGKMLNDFGGGSERSVY